MNWKIAIGVVAALVASCCGFAAWRHFNPTNNARGEVGCFVGAAAKPDTLQLGRCDRPHEAEMIAYFYPDGAEASCLAAAETFLGGPVRDSRVVARTLPHVDKDFTSLACALMETSSSSGTAVQHTGSLRNTMRGDRPMAISCGTFDKDDYLVYAACDSEHAAEYVGSAADGGQPETTCWQLAAEHLRLTPDQARARRDLTVQWLDFEDDHIGCLAAEAGGRAVLTGSLRNLGTAPLPSPS